MDFDVKKTIVIMKIFILSQSSREELVRENRVIQRPRYVCDASIPIAYFYGFVFLEVLMLERASFISRAPDRG